MLFSQNKSTRTVTDIWVNGTKFHVQYSDGSGKDMDMPPATSLRLPYRYYPGNTMDGYVIINETGYFGNHREGLSGSHCNQYSSWSSFSFAG